MEPAQKKTRQEGDATATDTGGPSSSPPETALARTIFVACQHIHSRGELVNAFFHDHRAAIGLDGCGANGDSICWYLKGGRLHTNAPVEVVHVKNSRRPYFLVEWRYPTAEELAKRKAHEEEKEHREEGGEKRKPSDDDSGDDGDTDYPALGTIPLAALQACADNLLALGAQKDKGELRHKDAPVSIMPAMAGITVAGERRKLLLRDGDRRRANTATAASAQKTDAGTGATQAHSKKPLGDSSAPTTTSFIPRAVRRR